MVVVVVRERNIGDAFFLKSWIFGTCKGVLFVVGVDTDAQVKKIPYMLVVGDQEMESGTVNMRRHGEKETTTMTVDEFIQYIQKNIAEKSQKY